MRLHLEGADIRLGRDLILSGIDLIVDRPGLVALMGASGVGKSTLLNVLAGLITPSAGRYRLDGKAAIIFQDAWLLPWQSAVDNAAFGLRAVGLRRDQARAQASQILTRLGITARDQEKRPSALSGGMRRRVALARALAIEPDFLLLDEAFTGLDPALRHDLQQLIATIVAEQSLAAILVTHDPVEAVTWCDRVLVLDGRPATLSRDLRLENRPRDVAEAYRMAAELMQRTALDGKEY